MNDTNTNLLAEYAEDFAKTERKTAHSADCICAQDTGTARAYIVTLCDTQREVKRTEAQRARMRVYNTCHKEGWRVVGVAQGRGANEGKWIVKAVKGE